MGGTVSRADDHHQHYNDQHQPHPPHHLQHPPHQQHFQQQHLQQQQYQHHQHYQHQQQPPQYQHPHFQHPQQQQHNQHQHPGPAGAVAPAPAPAAPHPIHRDPSSSLNNITTAEFVWNFGAHSVYVTGAWDDWREKAALSRTSQNTFTAVLAIPTGTFQYKFIVDGHWKHNPALPTQLDPSGNLNNVIVVTPQVLEYDSDFPLPTNGDEAPQACSPVDSYDFSLLPQEDHTTEPPALPRMLAVAPLDRDRERTLGPSSSSNTNNRNNNQFNNNSNNRSRSGGTGTGTNPNNRGSGGGGGGGGILVGGGNTSRADPAGGTDFVRFNHLFETKCLASYGSNSAIATIATETRYKSKVITTILITSKHRHHQLQQQQQQLQQGIPNRRYNPNRRARDCDSNHNLDSIGNANDAQPSDPLILDALNNV